LVVDERGVFISSAAAAITAKSVNDSSLELFCIDSTAIFFISSSSSSSSFNRTN
jgi:hypothetical protein